MTTNMQTIILDTIVGDLDQTHTVVIDSRHAFEGVMRTLDRTTLDIVARISFTFTAATARFKDDLTGDRIAVLNYDRGWTDGSESWMCTTVRELCDQVIAYMKGEPS